MSLTGLDPHSSGINHQNLVARHLTLSAAGAAGSLHHFLETRADRDREQQLAEIGGGCAPPEPGPKLGGPEVLWEDPRFVVWLPPLRVGLPPRLLRRSGCYRTRWPEGRGDAPAGRTG